MRKHIPYSVQVTNDNPTCPSSQTISGRCTYHTTGPSLSGNGPFLFTDTDFIECQHPGSNSFGGAIDCTSGDLTIMRCSFVKCYTGRRGGAVSFQSTGLCLQEDNLYFGCTCGTHSGAFDSLVVEKHPRHDQKRCSFIHNTATTYYGHYCLEYPSIVNVDSNIFIHGRSTGTDHAGTVINYHSQQPVLYSNCVFVDGLAYNSGGLSFLSYDNYRDAAFSVNFCFFSNNYNTNGLAYEIYFDGYTSTKARKDYIVHSFSATKNSKVFIQNKSPQEQDWLPLGTLSSLKLRGESASS